MGLEQQKQKNEKISKTKFVIFMWQSNPKQNIPFTFDDQNNFVRSFSPEMMPPKNKKRLEADVVNKIQHNIKYSITLTYNIKYRITKNKKRL